MATRETDPLLGFCFSLDFGGKIKGYFTECSGLSSENEVVEHKVVTETGQEVVQKIPGRLKWNDVTLKRGVTGEMDIWDWRASVEKGDMTTARQNASIIMYDRAMTAVARWDLTNAWPTKVSGPQQKTDSTEFGIEEITVACEGFKRAPAK